MSGCIKTGTLWRMLVVVTLVWLAVTLVDVLLIVFAGVLLAVLLRGLADLLSAHSRLSSGWALLVVLITLSAIAGLTIWLVSPELGRQLDELIAGLPRSSEQLRSYLQGSGWGRWLLDHAGGARDWLTQASTMRRAGSIASTTFGALISFFVFLIVGLYLAADPRSYRNGALRLLPEHQRSRAQALAGECGRTLRRWLLGKFASMLITGLLTGIGLYVIGIPLALVLGLLAALLSFIPNFGPILAAVPAILLGLGQSPATAGWVAGLYVVVQAVESYAITPLIQREMVALPPALIIVAQMALGVLVGGLGVVLATPLTALALVLVRRLYVEPIADHANTPTSTMAAV